MDNWIQILKLDQVNVGSTTLDTRELPKEDCCEVAREVYRESFSKYWGTNPDTDWLDEISCEELYIALVELVKTKHDRFPYYRKALEAWEECENA